MTGLAPSDCLNERVNNVGEVSPGDEQRTDEALARAVVAGQPDVFAQLYERYYARVYRMAYGMTGRHERAEDLTQDIFMRAYQKLHLFSEQSSFATWFYRLAFNHSLNHCQSERRQDHAAMARAAPPPVNALRPMDKQILRQEAQAQIHRALFSLKPKLRMIVILRDIEGLSYAEIAEQMNCSTGTLATQLGRARKLLARKLAHLRGALSSCF